MLTELNSNALELARRAFINAMAGEPLQEIAITGDWPVDEAIKAYLSALPRDSGAQLNPCLVTSARIHLLALAGKSGDGRFGGCISYIQRKLECGYDYAALIIQHLERVEFISPEDHCAQRSLIVATEKIG